LGGARASARRHTGHRIGTDLYTPSVGRHGLVLTERRNGIVGPFDFDVHPTNLGHAFIARQFAEAWDRRQ
jgi:hypothetical protein